MRALFAIALIASAPAHAADDLLCRGIPSNPKFSSVTATNGNFATLTASYADAGVIKVGGRDQTYIVAGDMCLGTSNGTPACTGGPELIWSPNNFYACNVTSGGSLRWSGTTLAFNGGGGCTAGAFKNIPVTEGANPKRVECGSGAMTAGALAVTFGTAFSAAPICNCTHVNTTNSNACVISSAAVPTTSGVTFAVTSGGTDVVHWCCMGDR